MSKKVLRKRKGRGFTYKYLNSGRTLSSSEKRQWIESLAVPPAWENVEIDLVPTAKVHASGYDSKGRKQYIYNQKWRQKRERKKFNRILQFADCLPKMRRTTGEHLRSDGLSRKRVLASMLRLLDNAYFRPGSQRYARENQSYGLTTLRSKHLTVRGTKMIFEYQGKSGKIQEKEVNDPKLAKIVKKMDELPGYQIFKYIDQDDEVCKINRDDLNEYIHEVMGDKFSAKDFRTWGATYLASKLLDKMGYCQASELRKKNIIKVIDQVAETLGNTRSIARASYIDPRIINQYEEGHVLSNFAPEVKKEIADKDLVHPEEKALVCLLEHCQS